MTEMTQQQANEKLLQAAQNGDVSAIEAALDAGADIDAKDNDGDTALIWVAANGHSDTCLKLIEKGVDIHAKDNVGNTALILAARNGHSDNCLKLIEKGADIDAKDNFGNTALIGAAWYGHSDTCLKLIEKGADIHAKNNFGDTALTLAAANGHSDTCLKLIEKGVDIDAKDNDGSTAVTLAAISGHSDTARQLLRHGAEPVVQEEKKSWLEGLLAEMKAAAHAAFPGNGDNPPTRDACFAADGKISDAALDACATGQFGTLVAVPLIQSTKPEDRQLFQDVWDKLPEHWQHEYQTLYVQFAAAGGVKPSIGMPTDRQQHVGAGRSVS